MGSLKNRKAEMSGLTSGAPEPGIRTYNSQVRVGNWNEDICLEEDLLKDFLERKENGTLLIQKKAKLRELFLSEVELTESKDGYIHFGDKIMIMNQGPESGQERVLAMYAEDKINGGLSASDNLNPCSRNTFTIRQVDPAVKDGEQLRYGQKFKLESIASPSHYLNSEHTRLVAGGRSCNRQSVFLSTEESSKNNWVIDAYDPLMRLEYEDGPVPHGTSLIIKHGLTGQCLCAEEKAQRTPFGLEKDVNAATIRKMHRNYRAEKWNNHWLIITGKAKPN